ncbi:DUF2848 domain-containing protein [Kibdelosporangium philippinense]|uniref:DUF2848 domain-containing protein n=1 Tax=Kibdelosporangium philippinense TaxID=211113 RepID=A0ABS8ZNQ5_9PSEU|nr:DUF2848 domain-containing protein [Kibdelosporangium philippinense]MCE7009374.1 DUF2848 domain-containing protein [Kibdelosporangium philippinense]
MTVLHFSLPDGQRVGVDVRQLLNAGFAGRSQDDVAEHVAELVAMGIPAPTKTPCLYPIAPFLAVQSGEVYAQHSRTSGEAEWAIVITRDEVLLTVACDHTDRDLEVHGVAWSKQAAPDMLGRQAWRLTDVADRIDELTLVAWVRVDGDWVEIQSGTCGELLPPEYWIDVLHAQKLYAPGTVLLSGTIPMKKGVDQFADAWRVELGDPLTGRTISTEYHVRLLPDPIA